MLILRKKEFSGYQPTHGISYIDTAQVTQKLDDGFGQSIDHIDRAVTGLKVLHANFGEGTIIDIEIPASKDPNKTKIKVMFDQIGKEKTLLLGKARLAIVD